MRKIFRKVEMKEVHGKTMETLNKLANYLPINMREKALKKLDETEELINQLDPIEQAMIIETMLKQLEMARKYTNSKMYRFFDKLFTAIFRLVELAIKALAIPVLDGFNFAKALFSK